MSKLYILDGEAEIEETRELDGEHELDGEASVYHLFNYLFGDVITAIGSLTLTITAAESQVTLSASESQITLGASESQVTMEVD